MAYYVYILTNRTHRVLYTGVTNNIVRRLFEHKNKVNDGCFTSRYNVNKLVFFQEFKYIRDAIHYEKVVKGWLRKRKIELINEFNPNWDDLGDGL